MMVDVVILVRKYEAFYGAIPKMVGGFIGLFHGRSHLEMDDDWGYPCFRKPPYVL